MLPFSARFFFENHLDRTFLSHVHRTKMIFSYATQCKLHKERNNLCLKSTKKINSKTWLIISFRKQYIWCKVFCNVKIVINSTIAGLLWFHKYRVILLQINSLISVFLGLFWWKFKFWHVSFLGQIQNRKQFTTVINIT